MRSQNCKNSGQPREIGRRLCRPCNLIRQRKAAKNRERTKYSFTCICCRSLSIGWRKTQVWCSECYRSRIAGSNRSKATNQYEYTRTPGKTVHRSKAEFLLNCALRNDEVVHHVDHDPKNNEVTNLMVLTRGTHVKLHRYLDDQRAVLEKSGIVNSENCWKPLIAPMTTAWLETTSAKVQKLWEIGQSAGEHRTGEASETMHGTPYQES